MTSGEHFQPPAEYLARRLAIFFAALAVLVSVLLVVAVMALVERQPATSAKPSPSVSPGLGGTAPGIGVAAARSFRGLSRGSVGFAAGEPPGDIEDETGRSTGSPPAARGSTSTAALPLPTAPTLPLVVPTPTPLLP
jgi:hypothetical protein